MPRSSISLPVVLRRSISVPPATATQMRRVSSASQSVSWTKYWMEMVGGHVCAEIDRVQRRPHCAVGVRDLKALAAVREGADRPRVVGDADVVPVREAITTTGVVVGRAEAQLPPVLV
jgi:hypothetical protein